MNNSVYLLISHVLNVWYVRCVLWLSLLRILGNGVPEMYIRLCSPRTGSVAVGLGVCPTAPGTGATLPALGHRQYCDDDGGVLDVALTDGG